MTEIPRHLVGCPMHGGLPVPRVASTRKGKSGLAKTEPEDRKLHATHKTIWIPEGDEPDFGKYDDEKLRECMLLRRCHVCWRGTEPLLICMPQHRHPLDRQTIEIWNHKAKRNIKTPLISQPWVCADCLKYAVTACPPLRRAWEERRGLVAFPRDTRLVRTYWKPANPGDPEPPPGATVVSLIKIALVDAAYTPLGVWAIRAGA